MDTSRHSPTGLSGALYGEAWTAAPCPVLIAGPQGDVIDLNPAAAALLPSATPGARLTDVAPAWIAEAHRREAPLPAALGPGSAPAHHGGLGGRTFAAHSRRTADGNVIWWLVDDTDRRAAQTALDDERRRTAFLADASGALLASLNLERCMEVTASLAAEHLAEAAVVVAPARGRGLPVTHCRTSGRGVHRVVSAEPVAVPGLGEALRGFPPVPSRWIDPAALPDWLVPGDFPGRVGSAVVTPLPGHGVPAGAMSRASWTTPHTVNSSTP
ncbi:hypothetical protein ACYF6T_15235 [Streptomyces sp. 7R007]